jgi:hypothetical protein
VAALSSLPGLCPAALRRYLTAYMRHAERLFLPVGEFVAMYALTRRNSYSSEKYDNPSAR